MSIGRNKKGCEPPRPRPFLGVLFYNYTKNLTGVAIVVTTYFFTYVRDVQEMSVRGNILTPLLRTDEFTSLVGSCE
jgi:hypothetical protein